MSVRLDCFSLANYSTLILNIHLDVPSTSRSTSQTRTIVAPVTPTRKIFRRRRSMLERWLDDQHDSGDEFEQHQYEPQTPMRVRSPYVEASDRVAGASTSSFVLVAAEGDREMGSEVRFPIGNTRTDCVLKVIYRPMTLPLCPPVDPSSHRP